MSIQVTANNVFNTVQWSTIDTVVNSQTFGQVTGVRAMRRITVQTRDGRETTFTQDSLNGLRVGDPVRVGLIQATGACSSARCSTATTASWLLKHIGAANVAS